LRGSGHEYTVHVRDIMVSSQESMSNYTRVPTLQSLLCKKVAQTLVSFDPNGVIAPRSTDFLEIPSDIAHNVLYELRAARTLTYEVLQVRSVASPKAPPVFFVFGRAMPQY
jgi:hypothetical protein